MPPKKVDPKKDSKAQSKAAKASSGGGKAKKKKWSKGKNKEKVNNAILFDKTSFEKMLTEVPKFKMITISILSDRLRIDCSLARRALGVLVVRAAPRHAAAAASGAGAAPPALQGAPRRNPKCRADAPPALRARRRRA
jgi:small subunit ribosomal protein S25e